MKNIITVIACLLISLSAEAYFPVAVKDHMQNLDPGRCTWCALETLGRTHGWKNIIGLVARNNRVAERGQAIKELTKLGIKHKVNWAKESEYSYYVMHEAKKSEPTVYSIKFNKEEANKIIKDVKVEGTWWIEKKVHWHAGFLRTAVEKKLGAAVSLNMKDDNFDHSRHMVVLTHMDDKKVTLVNSNDEPGTEQSMSLAEFLETWNGFAIMIEKFN